MVDINKGLNSKAGSNRNKVEKPLDEKSGILDKAVDSLSEQKKKFDIAMYYAHNDAENAKNMVSGFYKDLFVLKAKFAISTTYGAFICFFNIPYCSLIHSYVLISHSYAVNDLKTISPWRIFEEQMQNMYKQGGHDIELISKMRTDLSQSFTMQIGSNRGAAELKKYLELNDGITVNRIIKEFINDKFGYQNINPNVDYERISSLEMELFSTTSKKLDKELLSSENENKKEELNIETFEEESDEDDIDKKDIQLILRGNLVLSPIKGKEIFAVETGDRIKVCLNNSNTKAVTVAKALNAYDDGQILPVTGRVVSIRHLSDGGYKIFCIIAKGIYVKIEEAEEVIKIAVEIDVEEKPESSLHRNAPVLIAAAAVFLVLFSIALILVLKLNLK